MQGLDWPSDGRLGDEQEPMHSGGMSIFDTNCGQTEKIKIALYVASRTESQCANDAGSHAVIMCILPGTCWKHYVVTVC